jgi:hypothetical protein
MAYNIRLAWNNISSINIRNCSSKCITATGDGIEHEEEFLGFMAEGVLEVSHTLHDRLQVNDLQAWANETPITVHKGEEIVVEILNHKVKNIYWKMSVRIKKCMSLRPLN